MLLPFANRQVLKHGDDRVDLDHRRIEVSLVTHLLRLDGKPVLAEQRRDQCSVRDPEHGLHQPARDVKWRKRDLERVEIKQEKDS